MIRSMTGYGRAHVEGEDFLLTSEVRAVNNRFFKISVRLPEIWQSLVPEVENLVKTRLSRGSIQVRIHKRGSVGQSSDYLVNRKAIEEYRRQLGSVEGGGKITLAEILQLPGSVGAADESDAELEEDWKLLKGLVSRALDQLDEMRASEGANLRDVLLSAIANIRGFMDTVEKGIPDVLRCYRDRLRERIDELLGDANVEAPEEILARELAVYAERSDIREEIDRMRSHLKQFAELMDSKESVGRRLEFIVQEMFREANTMGSKAGDAGLNQALLDVKCEVDRLKEQVMNVE